MSKVLLILIDGMRADAVLNCENKYLQTLAKKSRYSFSAKTVMPSYTLPCHASLFFSAPAVDLGIVTNTWCVSENRGKSLADIVASCGKKFGMVHSWGELRDLYSPSSADFVYYKKLASAMDDKLAQEKAHTQIAIDYINSHSPELFYLYLEGVDAVGHKYGWMSDEYYQTLSNSMDCVKLAIENIPDDYTVIIMADHGGHDRSHGQDTAEDMTIPVVIYADRLDSTELDDVSIMDIAPTILDILNIDMPATWHGKSLL